MNRSKVGPAIASVDRASNERRVIALSSDEHLINDEVEREVGRLRAVFTRNNQLVEILRDDVTTVPKIRSIAKARLRELVTLVVQFVQVTDDGRKKRHPPDWCVAALHERGEYPSVRKLVGILECPALRPDGSVLQTPGYDAATGYVLLSDLEVPAIPDRPTQHEAEAALTALKEPFAEFPFASEADRSAVVAVVLTLVARPAIAGCIPAHLADAPTRGSGKTLKHDAIMTIATGRTVPKLSYPAKMDELEKVLAACALEGASVICFDNVTTAFGGGPLDKVLTARDTVKLRILGKTEVPELAWRAQVLASGNNMEVAGDTSRRCLRSRLESDQENPELRGDFQHDPLLPWIRQHRGRFIGAALTVLRAYVVANKEGLKTPRWGSFEEWSALVPPAIVYAGGADPMATRIELEGAADTTKAGLGVLLASWPLIDPKGRGVTASQVVQAVQADELAEVRNNLEALIGHRKELNGVTLGNTLRKFRRRVIGTQMLHSSDDAHTKVKVWWVVAAGTAGTAGTLTTQEGKNDWVHGAAKPPQHPQPPQSETSDSPPEVPCGADLDAPPEQGQLLFEGPEAEQ